VFDPVECGREKQGKLFHCFFFIVFGLAEAGPLDLEGPPLPSVQGSPPAPLVGNRTVRGPAHDAMLCDI